MAARNQRQLDLLSQWVDAQPESPRSPLTCWRCHQPGHLERECDWPRVVARPRSPRSPIKCWRCHQPGHLARECDGPRVSRRVRTPPTVQSESEQRRGTPQQPTRGPARTGLDSHTSGGGRPLSGDSTMATPSPSGVLLFCVCICAVVVMLLLINVLGMC